MFNCELCLYSTDRSSNLKQHFNSKKHIIRVHNEYLKNKNNDNNKNIESFDSEICQQIENIGKNSIKNMHFLTKKNTKFANQRHISESFFNKTSKNSIQRYISEPFDSQSKKINKSVLTVDDMRFECEECGKKYTAKKNLLRHKNNTICGALLEKKKMEENNKLSKLMEKMNAISEKLTNVENINNHLMKQIINTPQILNQFENKIPICNNTNISHSNNNNKIINNIITNNIEEINNQKTIVFNYVTQQYHSAPPLKQLKINDVYNLLTPKEKTNYTSFDFIIYSYKNHDLHTYLGKIITDEYKKEDPDEQQIWLSSVTRLTFIVRQILYKKHTWMKDINGVCITNYIIQPMLKEVKKMLQKYIKSLEDKKNMDMLTMEDVEKMQDDGIVAINIIKDINNKILHKQILKYVAPFFQLNPECIDYSEIEKKPTKKKLCLIKNK